MGKGPREPQIPAQLMIRVDLQPVYLLQLLHVTSRENYPKDRSYMWFAEEQTCR